MTGSSKNGVALLICLLLVLWLSAGVLGCAGLPAAGQDEASGNAESSMRATDSGFDLLNTGDVVRPGSVGACQYRPEVIKAGIYAVAVVAAVMFSAETVRLRLCQIVFIPFNFNWIPAYIHKKDGMK